MSLFPPGFFRRQFLTTPPLPTVPFTSRTIIITGSNTGLGLEAARHIVSLGAAKVILAVRNVAKGQAAAKSIESSTSCASSTLEVWPLDLSSYASVLAFCQRVHEKLPRLDALLCNAGLNTQVWGITEQDETTITTNVVSTALLACLLHGKLAETARKFGVRTHLSFTGSEMHVLAKFRERKAPEGQIFGWLRDEDLWRKDKMGRYATSKLLLMFVMRGIAEAAPVERTGVVVNVIAPGFCRSELGREHAGWLLSAFMRIFARTTEVGSRTLVHGAVVGDEAHGKYVPDCKVEAVGGLAKGDVGDELQRRVWSELRLKLEKI